jgi:hypothetical protein
VLNLHNGSFDAGAADAAAYAAADVGIHGGSLIRGAWSLLAEVTAHLSESADWAFLQRQWAALTVLEVRFFDDITRERMRTPYFSLQNDFAFLSP